MNRDIIQKVFKNTDNYYLLRSDLIKQIEECMVLAKEQQEAINLKRSSLQLKDKENITFEEWVKQNRETETYNSFLNGGFSFSLGDLYRKYAKEQNKPLIV